MNKTESLIELYRLLFRASFGISVTAAAAAAVMFFRFGIVDIFRIKMRRERKKDRRSETSAQTPKRPLYTQLISERTVRLVPEQKNGWDENDA